MAKKRRKTAKKAAVEIPFNALIFILLAVFVVQAGLVMYYNNGNMIFTNKEAFYSLDRGASFASGHPDANIPFEKYVNGYVYPVVTAVVTKLLGPSDTIPVIYILDFAAFFFMALYFFRIATLLVPGVPALLVTAVFSVSAPVILSVFSGADITLVFLLFIMNLYYLLTDVEKKKYSKAVATVVIMSAVSLTGLAFGIVSLAYIILRANARDVKRNYGPAMWGAYAGIAVAVAAVMSFIFIESLSYEYLQKHGILNTKTFYVDTFFKDGFLWSDVFPPFFTVFFYVYFFVKMAVEIKTRSVTYVTYTGMLVLAALIMEVIAAVTANPITGQPKTMLFISPFFSVVVLMGIAGIEEFSGLIQGKKAGVFSKSNILYGIIIFVIIYSGIFFFNKTIETNGAIKFIASDRHVQKFIER